MEDIRLPRHVIDRLEHRGVSHLLHDVKTWEWRKSRPLMSASRVRQIPVVVKSASGPFARA